MFVGVLGPLLLRLDGVEVPVPGRMERTVLTALALAEGGAIPLTRLDRLLWPDGAPDSGRNALQVKVSRLRALLGAEATRLEHVDGGYRLRVQPDETDAGLFAILTEQAAAALSEAQVPQAVTLLQQALALWRGDPLADLAADVPGVAARERLAESRAAARELLGEALAARPGTCPAAVAELRGLLHEQPLRPRARLLLMIALERSGRRAEALQVYDAGRRLLSETRGLEPPTEQRHFFESLLEAERAAAHGPVQVASAIGPAAPGNLVQTSHWLADQGDVEGAFRLAITGAWWWWLGGQRTAGRDLLESLLDRPGGPAVDDVLRFRAEAWAGALGLDGQTPGDAFTRTEQALQRLGEASWDPRDALAATLVAERLYEQGARRRADALLRAARPAFVRADSAWGLSVTRVVEARGRLLRGDVAAAEQIAFGQLRDFHEMGDDAGAVFCLDVLGYAAEVRGRLPEAAAHHRRALQTARRVGCPDWEARQLTRLGNVGVLRRQAGDERLLAEAVQLSDSVGSGMGEALARNGLGTALALSGEVPEAAAQHRRALDWYCRWGSDAGVAYTGARLAMLHAPHDRHGQALQWARRSVTLAVTTRDPRAVAFGLEAVALSAPEPLAAAQALGAARGLRGRVGAPLPEVQAVGLRDRERWMTASLGSALVPAMRQAAAEPYAVAEQWHAPPSS